MRLLFTTAYLCHVCDVSVACTTIHRPTVIGLLAGCRCGSDDFVLIRRALMNQFIIPEFTKFTDIISDLYLQCKTSNTGKVGAYHLTLPLVVSSLLQLINTLPANLSQKD